jgi:hypothetical protein
MPPSGYTKIQSDSVVKFLRSCCRDLEKVGLAQGLTPVEALKQESANITKILNSTNRNSPTHSVLKLTQAFYDGLKKETPMSYKVLRQQVGVALARLDEEILAVKVPELVGTLVS